MGLGGGELAWIPELLERTYEMPPREVRLERRTLRGGLEAAGIARVAARYVDHRGH